MVFDLVDPILYVVKAIAYLLFQQRLP